MELSGFVIMVINIEQHYHRGFAFVAWGKGFGAVEALFASNFFLVPQLGINV